VFDGAEIAVVAKLDLVKDGDVERSVHVSGSLVTKDNTEIFSQDLQDIQVIVEDKDLGGVCTSMNDPNLITFDGRYYQNFYEGEFILYQHSSLLYEIRAFYRKCKGKILGSCTCAIAARSGDDVILIDSCGSKEGGRDKSFLEVILYQIGDLTSGTSVRRLGGGLKYEIGLPLGTVIEVEVKENFLNVLIFASAADFNSTSGLCGIQDGDKDTVLTKRDGTALDNIELRPDEFSISWRVAKSESMYSGYCGTPISVETSRTLCECQDTAKGTCEINGELVPCVRQESHFNYWKGQDITLDMLKRSQPPLCAETSVNFEYDENQNAGDASWPTSSNITKEYAEQYCATVMNGTQGAACNLIIPDFVKYAIQSCVNDIKISDDLSWAQSALSTVLSMCRFESFNNPSTWVNITGNVGIDMTFINTICFNECSGHGQCVKGVCQCDEDYGLADCSLNITTAPLVFDVQNSGLCNIKDISHAPCQSVRLTGALFAFSNQLLCRLQPIKIIEGGTEDDGDVIDVQAEYFSFNEITCPFPEARSYKLQVTNNNVTFGVFNIFTLYHPRCHTCSATGVCSLTFESCFINNECYLYGEKNPSNSSLVCDSYQSYHAWSPSKVFPYVRGNPLISTSFNNTTKKLLFICQVTVEEREDVLYQIEWRHNSELLTKVNLTTTGVNSTVIIDSMDIPLLSLDSNVSCALMACFTDNCTGTESPLEDSNVFKVQIMISKEDVRAVEGIGYTTISVESNVPPNQLCAGTERSLCNVFILVNINQTEELTCPYNDIQVRQLTFPRIESYEGLIDCGVQYGMWPGPVQVPIKANLDTLITGDITRPVDIIVQLQYNSSVEIQKSIGNKEVVIIDNDSPTLCGSVNDPHITTFDGRTYDVYLEGEFILYQHSSMLY
jgi:hypothetical protein